MDISLAATFRTNLGKEEYSYSNPHYTMITRLRYVSEHIIFCCATKASKKYIGRAWRSELNLSWLEKGGGLRSAINKPITLFNSNEYYNQY